jgi:membrane protein YdbS with pleckstrin-like domain
MLNEEENIFVNYWEQNRDKKKKILRQIYAGLPLAVMLIIAIFVNFFSGWYKRADMLLHNEEKSLILVLFVAALLILAFIVIFSARHRWDMNEQRYRELLNRKNEE